MRTRKVGTLTLGIILIIFGILFLLRIFVDTLSYEFIFKMWPLTFILLGLEILYANFKLDKTNKLTYDKTAFFLIIILTFFSIGMAIVDIAIDYASKGLIL